MATVTRSFARYRDTVEVSYTFDDVSGVLLSVNGRNDEGLPAAFRVIHAVLGTWAQSIPPRTNQAFVLPVFLAGVAMTPLAGDLAFPAGFEFVGPH